ncbi:MAG: electron transport complex subunit RsxE, partial [Erysipelotrichaceae bacterium]|nr:electron transport complex subunit RsxE [Erysipelotrichaceae bacterium]
ASNLVVSLIRNFISDKVRIPVFITVIAGFVTIVQLLIKAYVPVLDESLGIFIPLITVNCIILGRAEAFASKNNVFDSMLDGLGMGLGYTFSLVMISVIRQVLGTGIINLTNPMTDQLIFQLRIIPENYKISMFTTSTGAFLTFALLAAALAAYKNSLEPKTKKKGVK